MAAELKAQRAQLERTHRLEAWAEMARQVAHEIKNPLTPIQLSAEHLRRVHADPGSPLGRVLEELRQRDPRSGAAAAADLGGVLELRLVAERQAGAGRRRPSSSPRSSIRIGPGLAGRIEIRNEVLPPLPPVLVDRTLIARALANIVENALHAMPGAGTLDGRPPSPMPTSSRSRVRDTGVGMDDEALARVFEPYFSTKTTGTGLGLPIARRNVESNGGTIDVTSGKGAGTTVRVRLPVAETAAATGFRFRSREYARPMNADAR